MTDTAKRRPRWGRILLILMKILLGPVLVVVLLLSIFARGELDVFAWIWNQLNVQALLLGVLFSALNYAAMAWRFRVFFKRVHQTTAPIGTWWHFTALNNFFNTALPFRSGELSFLVLLRHRFRSGISLASLVILRFYDAVIVGALMAASGVALVMTAQPGQNVHTFNIELLGLILISLVVLLVSSRLIIRWLPRVWRPKVKLLRQVRILMRRVDILWRRDAGLGSRLIALTLLLTAATAIAQFFLLSAFGVRLSLAQVLFMSTALTAISVLPIHSFFGLGTTQLVMVPLMAIAGIVIPVGITLDSFAISVSLMMQLVFILFYSALAAIAAFRWNQSRDHLSPAALTPPASRVRS